MRTSKEIQARLAEIRLQIVALLEEEQALTSKLTRVAIREERMRARRERKANVVQ